jgi:hypothetical protein
MFSRPLLLSPLLAVALLGNSTSLGAQLIRGQVVDSSSGVPVARGFVVLLSDSGSEIARTLTATDGGFAFALRHGGRYRVRSERIGYSVKESPTLTLAGSEELDLTLRVTVRHRLKSRSVRVG